MASPSAAGAPPGRRARRWATRRGRRRPAAATAITPSGAVAPGRGPLEAHEVGAQRQQQRRLGPPGVGVAAGDARPPRQDARGRRRASVAIARSTASRLPPWPLTSTTPPDQSAERTSSTIDGGRGVGADRQRAGEAGVLAAGRDGRATGRRRRPVRRAASPAARASATIVSVCQRQVRAVLLARADGDAQQRSAGDLGPRHLRQLHTGDRNPSPSRHWPLVRSLETRSATLTSSELEVVPSAPCRRSVNTSSVPPTSSGRGRPRPPSRP